MLRALLRDGALAAGDPAHEALATLPARGYGSLSPELRGRGRARLRDIARTESSRPAGRAAARRPSSAATPPDADALVVEQHGVAEMLGRAAAARPRPALGGSDRDGRQRPTADGEAGRPPRTAALRARMPRPRVAARPPRAPRRRPPGAGGGTGRRRSAYPRPRTPASRRLCRASRPQRRGREAAPTTRPPGGPPRRTPMVWTRRRRRCHS
ncbi:MAG: hypothetical protein U0531_01240 [Dehalococcoidia bacterium]